MLNRRVAVQNGYYSIERNLLGRIHLLIMTEIVGRRKNAIWIALANLLVLLWCAMLQLGALHTWSVRIGVSYILSIVICNLALWLFLQGRGMSERDRTILMAVILLLLGLLSNVAFEVLRVPDEGHHYAVAYQLFGRIDPSVETLTVESNWYAYLPSAIGLEIGRALGLSGDFLHILARMCSQIVFLVLIVISCKVAPDLRMAVWAIAALPATVWITASYSYDSWNLGFSILFICYLWRLVAHGQRVGMRELIWCALLFIAFAPVKFIYGLLALLVFAIPRERWHNIRQIQIAIVAAAAVLLVVMRGQILSALSFMSSNSYDSRGLDTGLSGATYSLSLALQHPLDTIMTFVQTMFVGVEPLTQRLLVGEAWSDSVPEYLTAILAVLFISVLLMATRETLAGRDSIHHSPWTMLVYRVTFVLGVLAVFVSFLFVYSYYNEGQIGVISGLQGRYFLPWVLLLVPAGSARLSVHCHDWMDRHEITVDQIWAVFVYIGVIVTLCRMVGCYIE